MKEYEKTFIGVIKRMYDSQKSNSKTRGREMPSYSKDEFIEWVLNQPNYKTIYKNWVESNYSKELIPSVDRPDSSKPYTLDNIKLMTWQENNKLGQKERSKTVELINLKTLEKRVFESVRKAAEEINSSHSNIIKVLNGSRNTVKGYTAKYI